MVSNAASRGQAAYQVLIGPRGLPMSTRTRLSTTGLTRSTGGRGEWWDRYRP